MKNVQGKHVSAVLNSRRTKCILVCNSILICVCVCIVRPSRGYQDGKMDSSKFQTAWLHTRHEGEPANSLCCCCRCEQSCSVSDMQLKLHPPTLILPAGNLPIVKYLVQQYEANYADTPDSEGETKPVYYAAQDGTILFICGC